MGCNESLRMVDMSSMIAIRKLDLKKGVGRNIEGQYLIAAIEIDLPVATIYSSCRWNSIFRRGHKGTHCPWNLNSPIFHPPRSLS